MYGNTEEKHAAYIDHVNNENNNSRVRFLTARRSGRGKKKYGDSDQNNRI